MPLTRGTPLPSDEVEAGENTGADSAQTPVKIWTADVGIVRGLRRQQAFERHIHFWRILRCRSAWQKEHCHAEKCRHHLLTAEQWLQAPQFWAGTDTRTS
jgi:hypothetical protein